ncbi:MAG TPA: chromosome segregation protein SMC [Propionibacteriaceae bacterium]|nr:chromosome segregation protein SMC [Propionibacteriaceae bacterium]
MYLKSLTLRGFKSFASATTLNFEPGVTCVVGPNGSGKSNVVDALSWVMGEQGAKTLRGGKMEDVIFAGTAARAPLGRAEVVLTIDNTDGALPIDYAEVTIARTMFRNGGSEYAINSQPARLLDVQDLLSDSGIGREMHVIVGQGQLDTILQATPEIRRGFIEEAAGVLKHRKRKEKALRKLEACEGNLNRLSDLIGEIRRQLKPLGRQAEVARRAAVIQAELRDAKARLLADDLAQANRALVSELADEQAMLQRRRALEESLEQARAGELAAEEAVRQGVPALSRAQETWYSLAALRERVATTVSIARERMRHSDDPGELRAGRDPDELDREAETVAAQERELAAKVAAAAQRLAEASAYAADREAAYQAEDRRLAGLVRAAADRREGLARLTGQVNSLRSRAEAAEAEIGRLTLASEQALERAERASRAFTALETKVAGLDAGELGLDAEHEAAVEALDTIESQLGQLRRDELAAAQERAGLAARVEALHVGLNRKDASAALLAASDRLDGLLGSVAALVTVHAGYETAISAAFGAAADAVAVAGLDAAVLAFDHLKTEDLGRAGLLLAGPEPSEQPAEWPRLPDGAGYAVEVVNVPDDLVGAVHRVLRKVAVVADLPAARRLVAELPDLIAVTREGDVLGAYVAAGGSAAQPSLIEVQAAIDDAERRLAEASHACDRLRFSQSQLEEQQRAASDAVDRTLDRLHESDAAMAAVAEELGQLSSTARSARDEADRLQQSIIRAEEARDSDVAGLADLEHRLELAETTAEVEPDPGERDRLADAARLARAAEMDARLSLRTLEERDRALAGRADALRRAAEHERQARAKEQARRARLAREAATAAAVHVAGQYLAQQVDQSLTLATAERARAEADRVEAEGALAAARAAVRSLGSEFESLVDAAHRDELARVEQRTRVEALTEKAMVELGLEPDVLIRDYGPDQLIPVLTGADDEPPEPIPYIREQQQRRLRAATADLAVLGRVNPLALEEFSALEERHQFLSTQLEDLHRTRKDLLDLIADVDQRVEQVFAEAYADVEQAFARVFSRLFPGGEGRLLLTEPDSWLTTGVEVEARPPGKKIKRLSLLSGGERSLVAVAFLVSLFIARPSPFYILDEVEAALDDVNLGRLLDIYGELRANSQLLVITHQKRTMEIADALYGVTMRGDGVSTVISQRLRETASVA